MTARAIVSIWFPKLAIERWTKAHRERADEPLALVTEGPRGVVIDSVTPAGLAGGARIGMKLADARAAFPALAAMASDKAGDAAALARLARWCERWSPSVQIDDTDGVLLDMTGGAHLHGGEAGLLSTISANFRDLSLTARVAIAPTAGAAWALSRYGSDRAICAHGDAEAMLAPLPVQALRLDDATCLLLHRLGLKRVGDIAALPPRALARRFSRREGYGADPWLRYAQATGRIEEPLDPFRAAPVPRAFIRLAEPVLELAQLAPLMNELTQDLTRQLYDCRAGARALRLDAFRIDGDVQSLNARTSTPTRDPAHLLRLYAEKLETLDAGFGFDAFALTASRHEPLASAQDGLIEAETDSASLARLVDRLGAKLGETRVRTPRIHESHKPERRIAWRPALAGIGDAASLTVKERPIRLLDRPESIGVTYATPEGAPRQFRWRKRHHRVVKVEGPERIAPEWWRAGSQARERDYYKVEDSEGRRYWLFRHGRLGDGAAEPDWYLHGLFA